MKQPILWKNEIVGFVEDMKVDMFDLYGKWIPANTIATSNFINFLIQGEILWIKVGEHIDGTIEFIPDDTINIKLRPFKD